MKLRSFKNVPMQQQVCFKSFWRRSTDSCSLRQICLSNDLSQRSVFKVLPTKANDQLTTCFLCHDSITSNSTCSCWSALQQFLQFCGGPPEGSTHTQVGRRGSAGFWRNVFSCCVEMNKVGMESYSSCVVCTIPPQFHSFCPRQQLDRLGLQGGEQPWSLQTSAGLRVLISSFVMKNHPPSVCSSAGLLLRITGLENRVSGKQKHSGEVYEEFAEKSDFSLLFGHLQDYFPFLGWSDRFRHLESLN